MDPNRVVLDPEPDEARRAVAEGRDDPSPTTGLRRAAGAWPLCLEAWAELGRASFAADDEVGAYAFFRVGYHRGLDRLRSSGWRPGAQVPFSEETNRGFLRALHGLMVAAAAISEGVEARRCREFLLQLDPTDPFGVAPVAPKDLSRRLPEVSWT